MIMVFLEPELRTAKLHLESSDDGMMTWVLYPKTQPKQHKMHERKQIPETGVKEGQHTWPGVQVLAPWTRRWKRWTE